MEDKMKHTKKILNKAKKKSAKNFKKEEKRRIKKYVKFLKKNPEWDYIYIIDLLRFKIRMSRKYISAHNIIVPEQLDQIVSKMKETEGFLKRVLKSPYLEELEEEFAQKFGGKVKTKMMFGKNKRIKIKTDYSAINPEMIDEAKLEHENLMAKEHELMKADLKKAFDIVLEYIWEWWD